MRLVVIYPVCEIQKNMNRTVNQIRVPASSQSELESEFLERQSSFLHASIMRRSN